MIPSTPEDAAFALFESGRLAQAERAWREILSRKPEDPDALHMLGYIVATTGRPDEGLALLDRAVEKAPRVAGIRSNRAGVLAGLGRDEEAERDVCRALDLEPRLPAALHLMGNLRLKQGRVDEAVVAYRKALASAPRLVEAHLGLGSALTRRGDRDGARACFEAALALDPNEPVAHHDLAAWWDAHGDAARAEAGYRRALALAPAHAASLNELGLLLRKAGRDAESAAMFEKAAEAAPDNPDQLNNLGVARVRADRLGEAIAIFERVLSLRPGFARAVVNLANALQESGDLDAAALRYEEAARLDPALVAGPYGRSQVAFRKLDFAAGWRGHELRFDPALGVAQLRDAGLPRLAAGDLERDETVAVWTEQGLGDQILYSTLLPELEGRRAKVVVEADPRLVPAFRRRFPSMTIVPAGSGAALFEGCTRQIPLGSLPHLFRNDLESFDRQPRALLSADESHAADMRSRLGPGRWVGLSWRSFQKGERALIARRKSIPLEELAALAGVGGAKLLDLQYGDAAEERAAFDTLHPGALTRLAGLDTRDDLEGAMAAIAACGLVITASNALAHLAGALGKPTWLLLRAGRPPFYYWVPRPDGRSVWYPAVEIVSDPAWTRWEQVIAGAARKLARE